MNLFIPYSSKGSSISILGGDNRLDFLWSAEIYVV